MSKNVLNPSDPPPPLRGRLNRMVPIFVCLKTVYIFYILLLEKYTYLLVPLFVPATLVLEF
jgi:hypothetical protein